MTATILLKGRGTRVELIAGGTITPGDLVTRNSSNQLIRHATAGGAATKTFAVEDDITGKGITDNYSANDYVQAETLFTGCEVYGFVAAAATAIVIGDLLEADASGGVRKFVSGVVIGQSLVALDNSAGGARARIKFVII